MSRYDSYEFYDEDDDFPISQLGSAVEDEYEYRNGVTSDGDLVFESDAETQYYQPTKEKPSSDDTLSFEDDSSLTFEDEQVNMPNHEGYGVGNFTNPELDFSGSTVISQPGAQLYKEDTSGIHTVDGVREGYTKQGFIDPRSPRWQGMSSKEILNISNEEKNQGLTSGPIVDTDFSYDVRTQGGNMLTAEDERSDMQSYTARTAAKVKEQNPEMNMYEAHKQAKSNIRAEGLATTAKAALMLSPVGATLPGMLGWGAATGGAWSGIDVAERAYTTGNFDAEDALYEVGTGAALGGVVNGTVGMVFKGVSHLANKFKNSNKVDAEVQALAQEAGIELQVGQRMDSTTMKALEDFVAYGHGGAGYTKARQTQMSQAGKFAENEAAKSKNSFYDKAAEEATADAKYFTQKEFEATDALRAAKTPEEAARIQDELYVLQGQKNQLVGETKAAMAEGVVPMLSRENIIKEAFPGTIKSTEKRLSQRYSDSIKKVDNELGKVKVTNLKMPQTQTKLKSVIDNEQRLGKLSRNVDKELKGVQEFKPKSFADMDLLKRRVSELQQKAYKKGNVTTSKIYGEIGDTIKRDMEAVAKSAGQDGKFYKELDQSWKELSAHKDSSLVKTISRKEFGDDVWASLKSGPSKDAKTAEFIKLVEKQGLTPDATKAALTSKFFDDALVAGNKGDTFSPTKYSKFIKDYKSVGTQFMSAKEVKRLEGVERLMKILGTTEKAAAKEYGSLSAIAHKVLPAALGGLGGYHGGGVTGAVAGFAAGAAGRTAMVHIILPRMNSLVKHTQGSKLLEKLATASEREVDVILKKLVALAGREELVSE